MNLDSVKKLHKMDKNCIAKSIEFFPDQIRQVLDDAELIKIPRDYGRCTNIVLSGMGGSNLGMRIVRDIFSKQIKVPILITPGYEVPAFVDSKTLYILSSYSGNTEETLSVYQEAKKRKAKIAAVTMDNPNNKLLKLMLKEDIPGYIFKPIYNPSNQPRLGIDYSGFGLAVILAKAGLLKMGVHKIRDVIDKMEIWSRLYKEEEPVYMNKTKKMAEKMMGRIPVLVAGEFLEGNLHTLRNQINENAKQFATYLVLPDLNHYAMEGLMYPEENKDNLVFIFFDSELYHPRIKKRAELTKQVVKKNGIPVFSLKLVGENKIEQGFEMLLIGSWISFYMAALNDVDPSIIPWVDWFKKQLG